MRSFSASFQTFIIRLLVVVMVLAMTAGPWAALVRPAAAASSPDLIVEAITTYPTDPTTGDAVTITVRVKNIGDAPAAGCYVTGEVDGSILGNQTIDQLQPDLTATATFPWEAVPGEHLIKATADSTGIVYESDETNNVGSYTLMPRAADLTIESITWTPEVPELRDEVYFSIRVTNAGTARSRATRVNFLVDYVSKGYQDVPALEPGAHEDVIYPWFAAPGQYIMTARVDEDGLNTESDEENNERSLTFTTALSDVFVQALYQSPENYSTGDTVTLIAEIKNQGTGPAGTSEAGFYINENLLTTVLCPSLSAGATANVSTTWTAQDGDNTLRVVTDYYHVLPELNEDNNEATCTLGTVPPDLTVSNIVWTPTDIGEGDTVTITFTITNQGEGRAAPTWALCQLGLTGSQLYPIPAIEPDASYDLIVTWLATAGNHQIAIEVNHGPIVEETKYSNNQASAVIMVTPPDLTIPAITWDPEHPDHNTSVSFNVTVMNQGYGTAVQSYVGYYIDDVLVYNTMVKSLDSGESVNMTFTWTAESGYHTFKAFADFKKTVAETDENNNELSVAIVANMPDLVIDSVTWSPADIPVGEDVTFTLKLHNAGTQSVPLTRLAYYVDDVMTGYVDVPPLAPDGTADRTLTWPVSSGQHRIEFVADATDLVEEIDEENNVTILTLPLPDLVVQDLSPSPAAPVIGDTVTLTVTLKNEGESTTQTTVLSGRLDDNTAKTLTVGPIGPGETVTRTFQWEAAGGTHTFSVAADSTDTTIEADETNNYRSIDVTTRTPDLTVGDLGWRALDPLVNDDVDLSAVITNIGDDTAPESTLVYQVVDEPAVSWDLPEIPAGKSYHFTTTVEIEPGEHVFIVTLDPTDAVWETDETNNSVNMTFNSKAPDLVIRTISWTPVEAVVGDNVTITVNLENRGAALVDGAKVTLNIDGTDLDTQTSGEIGIGESETLRFTWTLSTMEPLITALADDGGKVTESDETNNELSRAATFTEPAPPPPKMTALPDLSAPEDTSFISQYWWMILAGAGVIGAGVFLVLLRAFRKE